MANNINDLPTFAAGDFIKIQAAVDVGILTYPSYVFVRDKTMLAFIDQDLSIKLIKGNNKQQVVNVDVLPSVENADKEVLYIFNGIVYTFNGTDFTPMYKDVTEELEQIKAEIEALTGRVTTLEEVAHSPIQWIEL